MQRTGWFYVYEKRSSCAIYQIFTDKYTHEITNFIRYLAALTILFPWTSEEAGKMFSKLQTVKSKLYTQMSQEYLDRLILIRHDSNSSEKIKGTTVYA